MVRGASLEVPAGAKFCAAAKVGESALAGMLPPADKGRELPWRALFASGAASVTACGDCWKASSTCTMFDM